MLNAIKILEEKGETLAAKILAFFHFHCTKETLESMQKITDSALQAEKTADAILSSPPLAEIPQVAAIHAAVETAKGITESAQIIESTISNSF